MAGIYLHIPFCEKKCAYCDFYSVANSKSKNDFVDALCKEIVLRKQYLNNEKVQTIYFGGGTPSLLSPNQIHRILNTITTNFDLENKLEITLEANPDDLSENYLKDLYKLGINRLSIGVQSFQNEYLKLMRRRHTNHQAIAAIKNAQNIGFGNISLDLMYGLPNLSLTDWEKNIEQAINLNATHISAYHLTIEPNTLFDRYFRNGKINLPTETQSLDQFKFLIDKMSEKGFLHYEISNFAIDGFISLHNTNYWMGVKYLGLGPSAHSYNLSSRQWNIRELRGYLDGILKGELVCEIENLSKTEKFNDYIITSLRTIWGSNTKKIKQDYGDEFQNYFLKKSKKYIQNNMMIKNGENYILTSEGIFISDNIIQDFLFV
ncbi:MAG: radical SAM family heme chaperone HemW [Bacteroidales bacterium]|nr:radical SAM family heme chaperone HemW [Bacteroidales bacterium]